MIKSDKNMIEVDGTPVVLKSELCGIMRLLFEKGVCTVGDLHECVEMSVMSEEALDAQVNNQLKQMANSFSKLGINVTPDMLQDMINSSYEHEYKKPKSKVNPNIFF